MTEEQELFQDTQQLKQLISEVEKSGVSAWSAGELLKIVKDKKGYINKFGNFENYTKKEVGINPQTANSYITIREKFSKEEIGKLMLVTHLRVIAEIENDKMRKLVLKSFLEKGPEFRNAKKDSFTYNLNTVNTQSTALVKQGYIPKLSDIIGTVTMVLGSGKIELTENEIENIVAINIEKGNEEYLKRKKDKRLQKGTNDKALFGNQFKSDFFSNISELLENEPINEMGVVALFCIMFQSLQGKHFKWKNENVKFVSIKFIRSEFPDACVRCSTIGRTIRNFELDIEFEFESFNYVRHKHMQSTKNCDLIICWNDNSKTDNKLKNNPTVSKMPPVLSLKNCFETGKIELFT